MQQLVLRKNQNKFIAIELDGTGMSSWSGAIGSEHRDSIGRSAMQNFFQNDSGGRLDVVLAGENAKVEIVGLVLPARSYFDASGSARTRIKERSLAG